MAEETIVAAPSAAEVIEPSPSLEIPRTGTPEYQTWRETGEIPDKSKPKTEEPASSDPSKETTSESAKTEPAAAPESAKPTQETRRKPDAEARIKELTDKAKRLEQELAEARAPKTPAESSPAKPAEPQTYQDWEKSFDPEKWIENYSKEHPEASYEKANAAMFSHMLDNREQFRDKQQARESQAKEIHGKVAEAQKRYPNFNETIAPFVDNFVHNSSVSLLVKQVVNDSEVFADLAFTLSGDDKFMNIARRSGSSEQSAINAIKYIANAERLIQEELSGKGTSSAELGRNEQGRFTKTVETPAKRGPESAPPPPAEIGSRGAGPADESERALQSVQAGNSKAFRQWMEAENRQDLARRNGA